MTINLQMDGFWRDCNKRWVPIVAGLYCVYSCTNNPDSGTVLLHRLLYIGQSEDTNRRLAEHERMSDWRSVLEEGQELCYSVAQLDTKQDRDIAEAALVYVANPPFNVALKDSFSESPVTIIVSGAIGLLPPSVVLG